MKERFCSDELWEQIRWQLPKPSRMGRPRAEDREVFEGILWILKTGARWKDLPEAYPDPSTCWRRLRRWEEEGVWERIWRTFVEELSQEQALDWSQSFADGSFAPAKKGALESDLPNAARARSGWWWWTVKVFHWHANLPPHRPPK